jgi:hypothetical protein
MAAQLEQVFTLSGVWAAFPAFMGQLFDNTRNQMNNWRWDNACAFAIKSIAPNRSLPAVGRLNAKGSVSLGIVAMISGQRLRHQAAGSTCQATSWPLDH